MCNTLSVAKTLYNMFLLRNGAALNEASMQKFMYLVQRESLLVNRHVLFHEPFYGWKYGPVLYSVQQEYQKSDQFSADEEEKNCEVRNANQCGNDNSWRAPANRCGDDNSFCINEMSRFSGRHKIREVLLQWTIQN